MSVRERALVGLPRVLARAAFRSKSLVRFIGRKRQGGRDLGLDPQVAAMLEIERIGRLPALDSMEPVAARRHAETMNLVDVDPAPMANVTDIEVAGPAGPIPVRVFVPHGAGPNWLVYLHGGGGVIGSIASSDAVTRLLAEQTRCTVASVAYRLGPEHKHPAAIDDANAAWAALVARAPAGARIAVGGDSFGGYLAAHVEHHARTTGGRRPDLQVLIYPIVDETLTSPALDRLAHGYLLTKPMILWFSRHYHSPGDDLRATSPLFWPDLAGAAPAIIVVAGFDPLCDEGAEYAGKLRAAGVSVTLQRHDGLIHGFLGCAGAVTSARAAIDELTAAITASLASPRPG